MEIPQREMNAIERYVSLFRHTHQKIHGTKCYKLVSKDGEIAGYALVVNRFRNVMQSFPLPVDCKDLVTLFEKRMNPVVIWACDDGILYADLEKIRGDILVSMYSSKELIAVYEKRTREFKYLRY